MGYTEAIRTIHAPVTAVWNALNDIENTPKWVVGLEHAAMRTEQAFGAGTVYVDYNRLGPKLQVTAWHITEFEPLTRQVHVSASKALPSTMTLVMRPVPEGTRLKMSVQYHFMPQWGIVGRLIEAVVMNFMLGSVLKQNMSHLDTYLQGEAHHLEPVGSN